MLQGQFWSAASNGWTKGDWPMFFRGSLCIAAVVFMITCFLIIVVRAISEWVQPQRPKVA
jgi:hypothetical protein